MSWEVLRVSASELDVHLNSLSNDGKEVFNVFPYREGKERFMSVVVKLGTDAPAQKWQVLNSTYDALEAELNGLPEGCEVFEIFAQREGTHTFPVILTHTALN